VTSNVPIKTPEAVAELSSRQRKLSQRHRTVLLLVDGRRAEQEVRKLAAQAGSPESCFDELLDLGMISRPMPLEPELPPAPPPSALVDLTPETEGVPSSSPPDSVGSLLPPSLSLQPESHLDSNLGGLSSAYTPDDFDPAGHDDPALEEARAILLRAVRAEAPVAGSLTMIRLRRARSREDLEALLEEVESRIFKPFKGLWASQTMARVRELLATHPPLVIRSA
jgi:hypothetical protein